MTLAIFHFQVLYTRLLQGEIQHEAISLGQFLVYGLGSTDFFNPICQLRPQTEQTVFKIEETAHMILPQIKIHYTISTSLHVLVLRALKQSNKFKITFRYHLFQVQVLVWNKKPVVSKLIQETLSTALCCLDNTSASADTPGSWISAYIKLANTLNKDKQMLWKAIKTCMTTRPGLLFFRRVYSQSL